MKFISVAGHNKTQPGPDSVKQELFVRTHYIEGLTKEFEKVSLLPSKQRLAWVEENEQLLSNVLDKLMFDSDLAMNGMSLDAQTMALSADFVTKLRQAATLMRQIVRGSSRIEN